MGGVETWYEQQPCLSDKCRGLTRRHKFTVVSTGSGEVIAGPSIRCLICGFESGLTTTEPGTDSAPAA